MKILLINDYAIPSGGAEITVLALKKELEKRGHEVKLFASSAKETHETLQSEVTCYGTLSPLRSYLQVANFSAFRQLRKLLAKWHPDVVHVSLFLTQLSPIILPLLRTYPTLWHLHWYRGICPIGTKSLPNGRNCPNAYGTACLSEGCLPLHKWLPLMWQMSYLRRHKRIFRRIVANSNFVRSAFETFGYDNIDVIWCGTNNIQPGTAKRSDFSSHPKIVFAGRLVKEKGAALLLRAFHKVLRKSPQSLLTIAGDGVERENLQSLSRVLGIDSRVDFLGHVSRNQLELMFSDAWMQVVPSVWNEPFGLTVIEGMMRGTPVIATRVGGFPELINHLENGVLTDADEDELANAILHLIEHEPLRVKIRINAEVYVRMNFGIEQYADRFLTIYMEMMQH